MPENKRIEYKHQLKPELEKEVVAFLNSNENGIIYMGIDKAGGTKKHIWYSFGKASEKLRETSYRRYPKNLCAI